MSGVQARRPPSHHLSPPSLPSSWTHYPHSTHLCTHSSHSQLFPIITDYLYNSLPLLRLFVSDVHACACKYRLPVFLFTATEYALFFACWHFCSLLKSLTYNWTESAPGPAPFWEPTESASEPAPFWEPTESASEPAPFREPTEPAPEPTPFREPTEYAPGPAPFREPTESAPEPAPFREPTESAPEPAPFREPTQSAPEPAPFREPTQYAPDSALFLSSNSCQDLECIL